MLNMLLVDAITNTMKLQGKTLDAAASDMLKLGLSPEEVAKAKQYVYDRTQQIVSLTSPAAMVKSGHKAWYSGPTALDRRWNSLCDSWRRKGWPEDVIESVDQSSSKVVANLDSPGSQGFATRGLVLGYVQSGKTANFTGVVAKAADCGYRVIVVLAGIHEGLRRQTQERLQKELIDLQPELWHSLTTAESDFNLTSGATGYLTDHASQTTLIVVKKNATRLRKLKKWFKSATDTVRGSCPVLMVDDEADQASVDTKGTERASTINSLIIDILGSLPRSAYLAYTATPFANILSDPSERRLLYPRDFIVDLPRPAAYFGAERLFGTGITDDETGQVDDGLDVIREVNDDEIPLLRPQKRADAQDFQAGLPTSLREAIQWFLLACAIRLTRGHHGEHMSMLVHSSELTATHERVLDVVHRDLDLIRMKVQQGDATTHADFRARWDAEAHRAAIARNPGTPPPAFDDAMAQLPRVLERCKPVLENGKSLERLSFPESGGSIQVIVGGNTLSRGLTIEGLMVSYFVRSGNTYDTLLQMGRWFGYRIGYEDLPRIWMSAELNDGFQHLARVEASLREQIERYERESATPIDFAVKIATHPSLAVTAPMKMRYAVSLTISYEGDTQQTTYFNIDDHAWLSDNIRAARALLERAARTTGAERVWEAQHWLWRGVHAADIVDFLNTYRIHERHRSMQPSSMIGYIEAQNRLGKLLEWNVGVVTRKPGPGDSCPTWTGLLPGGEPVHLINRALVANTEVPNIKALLGKVDRALDFGLPSGQAPHAEINASQDNKGSSYVQWAIGRRSPPHDRTVDLQTGRNAPLLLIYPINKESAPAGPGPGRVAMNAVEHVVGFALLFPSSTQSTPQNVMVTADLSRVRYDEIDEIEAELEE